MPNINDSGLGGDKPPVGTELQRGHPLAQGLVGCYLINEGAGKRCNELVGQTVPGILGSAGHWAPGGFVMTANANETIECGRPPQINMPRSMTVLCRIRPTKNDRNMAVAGIWNSFADAQWLLYLGQDAGNNQMSFLAADQATSIIGVVGTTSTFQPYELFDIAGVVNYGTGYTYLYKNGVMDQTVGLATGGGMFQTSPANLEIGAIIGASTYYYWGITYHLYIWNRALSTAELQWLYADPYAMFAPPKWRGAFTSGRASRYYLEPSGALTPSGVLQDTTKKVLAGASTPSGTLVDLVKKILAGASTPSGTLVKLVKKVFSGGSTPSGALIKLCKKVFSGGITPSGTLTLLRIYNVFLTGASTPAGVLVKLVKKAFSGGTTPSGALKKLITKSMSGGTTPSGALQRTMPMIFSGCMNACHYMSARIRTILGAGL